MCQKLSQNTGKLDFSGKFAHNFFARLMPKPPHKCVGGRFYAKKRVLICTQFAHNLHTKVKNKVKLSKFNQNNLLSLQLENNHLRLKCEM